MTVASPALQGTRSAVTDMNGNYVIRGLPPGNYTATIEMAGMATRTEKVVVALGSTTTLDATMALAGVSENVQVAAESSPVVTNTVTGANYRKSDIDALPVGRTPQFVAELAPNLTDNTPNSGQLQIAGGFAFDNVFLMDGVDINDNIFASPNNLFIEDAIDETQVLTARHLRRVRPLLRRRGQHRHEARRQHFLGELPGDALESLVDRRDPVREHVAPRQPAEHARGHAGRTDSPRQAVVLSLGPLRERGGALQPRRNRDPRGPDQ